MKLGSKGIAALAVAWVLIFVAFYVAMPNSFATLRNLETLTRQTSIVAVAALAMTFVIVAGGIDLSVGSVAALGAVVCAYTLRLGWNPALAALAALGVGTLCGLLNGAIITGLRVGPFIVTLSTLLAMRGAAKGLANEEAIRAQGGWTEQILASLPKDRAWMMLAPGVWLTLALAAFMGFVLRRTKFGRHVVAVGANERAARYSAIPVEKVRLQVYALSGLFAGLAGLFLFSRLRLGDPTIAQGFELDVVAATVIGGASLSGGQGSVAGSVLGALIMSTIRAGGSQLGWSNWIQEVATGIIIVAAVALDRVRAKAS